MADGVEELDRERRIRHSRETAAVLERILSGPTPQDIAAFHALHARHLRELGDEDAATQADDRADNARGRPPAYRRWSPSGAFARTEPDATGEANVGQPRATEAGS